MVEDEPSRSTNVWYRTNPVGVPICGLKQSL